jgi:IS5 family transposase
MKKITGIVGAAGTKLHDRSRSVKLQSVRDRANSARQGPAQPGPAAAAVSSLARYDEPGRRTGEAVLGGDIARRKAIGGCSAAIALEGLRAELEEMVPLVRQVMRQTRARLFHGDTHVEGKILNVFEPSTEVIRKGKAGKPNEFGKMIKLQEAENQIIVDYEIYAHSDARSSSQKRFDEGLIRKQRRARALLDDTTQGKNACLVGNA